MNALFVLRPAKLWAFNIGHPCLSLAKGELLLLSQAQPTIEGSFTPNLSACTITSADNPSIVGSASHCNRSSPLHNGAKCDSSSPKFSTSLKLIPHYHSTPDRHAIPQKSATLSKVGTVSGDPPPAVNATKAYIHLFKRQICRGSQPQGRNSQRRPAARRQRN